MPRFAVVIAAAVLALAITACSRTMDASDIERNPHPVQAYRIVVTTEGAPGAFDSIKVFMHSEIANPTCAPKDLISGARPTPSGNPEFPFRRVRESYVGTVYFDALLDGNYFWLGRCHWQPNLLNVQLRVGNAIYVAGISPEEIAAHSTTRTFFSKDSYSRRNEEDWSASSLPTIYEHLASEHPEVFFSIVISAKEHAE